MEGVMVPLRFVSISVVALFGLLLLVPQFGRGEDAYRAFAEYQRFMPGNSPPSEADCDTTFDNYPVLCRIEGGVYCEYGYLVVRDRAILSATFFKCHFPLAYLTANYGHYQQISHYRRVVIVAWPTVSAHLNRSGLVNSMQTVHVVAWRLPIQR
jgi:hypothetical protein